MKLFKNNFWNFSLIDFFWRIISLIELIIFFFPIIYNIFLFIIYKWRTKKSIFSVKIIFIKKIINFLHLNIIINNHIIINIFIIIIILNNKLNYYYLLLFWLKFLIQEFKINKNHLSISFSYILSLIWKYLWALFLLQFWISKLLFHF